MCHRQLGRHWGMRLGNALYVNDHHYRHLLGLFRESAHQKQMQRANIPMLLTNDWPLNRSYY